LAWCLHQESHKLLVAFLDLFGPFWVVTRPQGEKSEKLENLNG
jgi:hypothetical protein